MKRRVGHWLLLLLGCGLLAVGFWARPEASVKTIQVHLKMTDEAYHPLPGVPARIVLGAKDWQSPDAGTRVVSDEKGEAVFTTTSIIDKRIVWENVGSTPFSLPMRVSHLALAAELETVLPQKNGDDVSHHWLYTADIHLYKGGDCSTDGLTKIYEAGKDGRFTARLGEGVGHNFQANLGGLVLSGMRYKMWNYMLSKPAADTQPWTLELGLMRLPPPVIR